MTREELRDWIAARSLPTLARWFGKPQRLCEGGNPIGDCEVTSSALYVDLVRTREDAGWSLVFADLDHIGRHTWLRYVDGERTFAVNANDGALRVLDEAEYLAANDLVVEDVRAANRRDAARLHAIATRIHAGVPTEDDIVDWQVAFKEQ